MGMNKGPTKAAADLEAYRVAYRVAMEIFKETKKFSRDEKYSLTDQIRRSSRAVCANLKEAWAKRRYPAHFISKLTDADAENSETETWLDFAKDCGQLPIEKHAELVEGVRGTGRMLGGMLKNPQIFCPPQADPRPQVPDP
jgi:four helix bundle protein